jgi:hypothetical protein
MAITLDTIDIIHEYINRVMEKSNHHAQNVDGIALSLMGAVVWKSKDIKVREYNGKTGNILWFEVNGNRYAFRYEHTPQRIELLKDSLTGNLLHTFDNNSTLSQVINVFNTL